MNEFLKVIQGIDNLGKMRKFPKDRLQLEINFNNDGGCPDEIVNLLVESFDSVLKKVRNARLCLLDNQDSNKKSEWVSMQRLDKEKYWISFPRTSYDSVSVLEKELRKIVNSEPLDIPSRLIYASGKLDSIHKASRYKAPPEIPSNKNNIVREVLKKGDNEKLSQPEISAMISAVSERRKGY